MPRLSPLNPAFLSDPGIGAKLGSSETPTPRITRPDQTGNE